MNIKIISVGRLKETYLKKGIEFYTKKLLKLHNVKLLEIDDEKAPEKLSAKEEEQIKIKEGQGILKNIGSDEYVIALDLLGKELTTVKFKELINGLVTRNETNITFVIGGSLGISPEVLKRADYKICFSKMTFPHQLMRLILLEQLDRISQGSL